MKHACKGFDISLKKLNLSGFQMQSSLRQIHHLHIQIMPKLLAF